MYRGGGAGGGGNGNGIRGRGRGGTRGRGAPRGRGASSSAYDGGAGGGGGGGGEALFVRGGGARGRGRGRGAGGQQGESNGQVSLELLNLPPGVEYRELVSFVNEHAPHGFRYTALNLQHGNARMTLAASDVASVMAALSGQQVRSGYALRVELGASSGRSLSHNEREALRTAVRAAYDVRSKTLNLASLATTPNFPFVNFQSNHFTTELWNALAVCAADCVSANLAQNQIQSLASFVGMARAMPLLENLSLQGNAIASVDQLEHLNGYRDQLRELILTGNPLLVAFTSAAGAPPAAAAQLDYSVYQQYVSSLFPALKLLDMQRLQSLIEFDLPPSLDPSNAPTTLPPHRPLYFDTPQHQKMCFAFVARYFELYDRDRQDRDLMSVYADTAMFSLCYASDSPVADARYTDTNRNIMTLGAPKQRGHSEVTLLRTKPLSILSALTALPPSKHDRDSLVADIFKVPTSTPALNQQGGLLCIALRGQFLETSTVVRCFHRTFLCTSPSQEARSKNWPVSIVNDSLYIGAVRAAPPPPAAAAAAAAAMPSIALSANDQQLVMMLCQQTGIDASSATQLLMNSQGDLDRALAQAAILRQAGQL